MALVALCVALAACGGPDAHLSPAPFDVKSAVVLVRQNDPTFAVVSFFDDHVSCSVLQERETCQPILKDPHLKEVDLFLMASKGTVLGPGTLANDNALVELEVRANDTATFDPKERSVPGTTHVTLTALPSGEGDWKGSFDTVLSDDLSTPTSGSSGPGTGQPLHGTFSIPTCVLPPRC